MKKFYETNYDAYLDIYYKYIDKLTDEIETNLKYDLTLNGNNAQSHYFTIWNKAGERVVDLRVSDHNGKYGGYDLSINLGSLVKKEEISTEDLLKDLKIINFEDDLSGEWMYKNADGIVKEDFSDFSDWDKITNIWFWNDKSSYYERFSYDDDEFDDFYENSLKEIKKLL